MAKQGGPGHIPPHIEGAVRWIVCVPMNCYWLHCLYRVLFPASVRTLLPSLLLHLCLYCSSKLDVIIGKNPFSNLKAPQTGEKRFRAGAEKRGEKAEVHGAEIDGGE